jgi:serine/threonine-protein kinase
MSRAKRDRNPPDPLTRLAAKVANGDAIDWDIESAQTPGLDAEIGELRWIETISHVRAADPPGSEPDLPREGRAVGTAPPRTGPLAAGEMWGSLKVIERIGWGTAGDIYRAWDPALGRDVALKIWREDAVYRTTGTEARRLNLLNHPRILKLLGSDRQNGLAGMWTDFIEGRNLEELLEERGPLPVDEACRAGIGVCEALEAVHANGMVHRDINTKNVMWLADESVVLIDFGSVKELPNGVPEHSERIRGTPLTTAPELFLGEPIAPTADIYSLGALLYRLVTRAYPVEAGSVGELFAKIQDRQATPLRDRLPGGDPAFVGLVDRMIAWDPGDRPSTVTDVRVALEKALS